MDVLEFKRIAPNTILTFRMIDSMSENQLHVIRKGLEDGDLCQAAYDPDEEAKVFIEHVDRRLEAHKKEIARKTERNRVVTLKWCCASWYREVCRDEMIHVTNHVLFEPTRTTNYRAYFLSDGGHGGAIRVEYCPFCGAKLSDYLTKLD